VEAGTAPIHLRTRTYLRLLLLASVVAAGMAVATIAFLLAYSGLKDVLWEELPEALDLDPHSWYTLVVTSLGGLVVGVLLVIVPGHGGPSPAQGHGIGMEQLPPVHAAGMVLVSLVSLVVGASLGPEAALLAVALAIGTLVGTRVGRPELEKLVGGAGVGSLLSGLFGSPIAPAVLLLEVTGVTGHNLYVFLLPVLVASAIGLLTFDAILDGPLLDIHLPGYTGVELVHVFEALAVAAVAAGVGLVLIALLRGVKWALRPIADRTVLKATLGGVGRALWMLLGAVGLVLLVAENRGIQSLGPVAAIGVTCSFAAGLTLLPALLTIGGRRAFWPRRSAVEWDPEHAVHVHRGLWRRLGDRVLRRPGLALAGTLVLFGIGALGLLAYKEDYSTTTFFKKETESVEGFKVLERALPAGALSPLTVLVEREEAPVRAADVARARRIAASQAGVATVTPPVGQSRDGRIARFDVILEEDPFKSGALGIVPDLRDRIDTAAAVRVLVGGGTAIQYDYDRASARDLKVIVPIALAVITLILAILLQALVAPLVLIASVVVSFFGTFGLSLLFIRYVVGDAGIDNGLPTFAFIFLVALGIDYTIFLMSRVREEARRHGTREGMLRALGATGPVITSAGIILAGTFSVLMTLPVTFAFDLGFMVALGILLDTFVVRTIMVPAAVELLGDRVWWPSGPGGGARIIDEMQPEDRAGKPGPAVSVS